MDVTAALLQVFLVEKQLRGLKGRLKGAERFLSDQDKELTSLESKRAALEAEHKQALAQAHDNEGEVKRLDAKIATIRSQMDNSQSNKEYKAFLTETNTFKVDRDKFETVALEHMKRAEDLKQQISTLSGQREERQKVRHVAVNDRDARHNEIADRVKELTTQREGLAKAVPTDAMMVLQRLVDQRGDEAMGVVEFVDVKRHEFNCGVCMMSLPVDAVVNLATNGRMTRCSSCQCILYIDDAGRETLAGGKNGKANAKTKKAKAENGDAPKAKAPRAKKAKQEEEVAG
jgi:uncharacterized protein